MNLLRLLLFLPGITFSLFSAEIFPYALLYSFVMYIKIKKIFIDKLSIFILVLLISSLFSLNLNFKLHDEILRSLVAYLNVIVIFQLIINSEKEEIKKIISMAKISYLLLLTIAILQVLNLLWPLDPIFSFLIPRFSSTFLDYSRGASLLSSEPSRASLEFIFLTLLMSRIHKLSRIELYNNLIYFALIFAMNLFVFKSLDGFFLSVISFIIYFRHKFSYLYFLILFSLLSIVFNERIEALALQIILENENFMQVVSSFSGFRISSVFASFTYGISHLFGSGVGNWQISSLAALNSSGIKPEDLQYFQYCCAGNFRSLRPTSFIANLMLDIGLLGSIFFLLSLLSTSVKFIKEKVQFNFFLFFVITLLILSSVGDPIPWICVAIVLKYKKPLLN